MAPPRTGLENALLKLRTKAHVDLAGPLLQLKLLRLLIVSNTILSTLYLLSNWLIVQLRIMDAMEDGLTKPMTTLSPVDLNSIPLTHTLVKMVLASTKPLLEKLTLLATKELLVETSP